MPSRLDGLYRRLLITRFFEKGWGKPENLRRLFEFRKIISNRETCVRLIPKDYPIEITKEEKTSAYSLLEGKFISPLDLHLPGLVPEAARVAHFQVILPNKWNCEKHKPVCIHLAGTGDHYFWRRRNLIAKPLLREAGLGAILLENPFYGLRKPESQVRSNLQNVSDIFVMGGCLILESLVLLHWCERNGLGPLGITGLSMGGHMASLAATNWPKPLVLVPCLSWSTAASVFTTGVMSQSINWDTLETQYYADGNFRERLAKMVTVVDDAFIAGQQFIQNFRESMTELQKDMKDAKHLENSKNLSMCSKSTPTQITGEQQTKFMQLNDATNMQMLFNKLVSTQSHQFTNTEINELEKHIKIIQKKNSNNNKNGLNDLTVLPAPANNLITAEQPSTLTKLMSLILPSNKPETEQPQPKIELTKNKLFENEALQFMRGVMDECTHLKNFSVPYDTSLIISVCAKDDAYVPREGCSSLEDIWPGAEIRYLDAGHVSAYVLYQKLFRACIIEAFEKAKKKIDEENDVPKEAIPFSPLTFDELQQQYRRLQ